MKRFFHISVMGLALAVLAGLFGCAHFPPQVQDQAGALIARIRAFGPDRGDFKAIGRFRLAGPQMAQSGRLAWLCSPPDRFRLEVLSPFGQPLATLSSDSKKLYVYARAEGEFLVKKPSARVLKKILGLSLSARDLVLILSGRPPVLDHKAARVAAREDGMPGQVLELFDVWGRVRQRIWVGQDNQTVERTAVYGKKDAPEYQVFFEPGQDGALPGVRVVAASGQSLELSPQQYWDHEKVEDAQFSLSPPGM